MSRFQVWLRAFVLMENQYHLLGKECGLAKTWLRNPGNWGSAYHMRSEFLAPNSYRENVDGTCLQSRFDSG